MVACPFGSLRLILPRPQKPVSLARILRYYRCFVVSFHIPKYNILVENYSYFVNILNSVYFMKLSITIFICPGTHFLNVDIYADETKVVRSFHSIYFITPKLNRLQSEKLISVDYISFGRGFIFLPPDI